MKKLLISIFIVMASVPFALSADIDVIQNKNSIDIINMPFKDDCIGNCYVAHTEKPPYARILRCKVSQKTQNPDLYGVWMDTKLPKEVWTLFDKYYYKKYGKYSPWHNNPDPIIKNENELAAIRTDKRKSIELATAECKKYGGSSYYDKATGACHMDMTAGMTTKEKSDYAKAKTFEKDYKNYLKYKSGY